jgi:quercetin dioxygenase-like cupin family protein
MDEKRLIKNLEFASVVTLVDSIPFIDGEITEKILAQEKESGLVLVSIDKGLTLNIDKPNGDAMILALEGTCEVNIEGSQFTMAVGQAIVLPTGRVIKITATERLKILFFLIYESIPYFA